MIQSQSYAAATPFAAELASRGLKVIAVPGTVLSELVRLSVPPLVDPKLTTDADLNTIGSAMQSITEGTLENPTEYSRTLGAYVNDIAKVVSQHVNYAKNVVRPTVTQFAENLQQYLANAAPKDPSEQFCIKNLRLPAVLKDESFLDTLSYYKDKSVLTPDLSFSFEPKTNEELAQMILVGSDRIDQQITEWASHLDPNYLVNTWNAFFTKQSIPLGQGLPMNYGDVGALNAFERADQMLAILLLARRVTNEVQSEAIPLNVYKNTAIQYTDYAGAGLVEALRRIELAISSKQLIVSVDSRAKCAKVNGELYGAWLDEGGSPETIMGLIVSGNQPSSMELINKNVEQYKSEWNSYCLFYRTSENNKAFDYAKSFIMMQFSDMLKEQDPVESEYFLKNPEAAANILRMAQAEVDNLKTPDLKDPYAVALCLVAKCRFYYTAAFQILTDIHEAGKVNPNVDVREAALLAVINYVADFMASQMVTTAN